jgi:hypothetical protein
MQPTLAPVLTHGLIMSRIRLPPLRNTPPTRPCFTQNFLEHFQEKWKSGFPSENATMQKG